MQFSCYLLANLQQISRRVVCSFHKFLSNIVTKISQIKSFVVSSIYIPEMITILGVVAGAYVI